jgi:hypothetical protein
MPSLVYVLHSSPKSLSPSLYNEKDSAVVLDVADPAHPGTVLRSDNDFHLKVGQSLSYQQLLNALLGGAKVISL